MMTKERERVVRVCCFFVCVCEREIQDSWSSRALEETVRVCVWARARGVKVENERREKEDGW